MRFEPIVFFVIHATVAFAGKLPDDFKVCKLGIAHYDECLKDAFYNALVQLENGMPVINAPPLNPVEVPSAVMEMENFVLTFDDLKLFNITKLKIVNVKSSNTPEKFEAYFDIFNEDVTAISDYTLKGKLILLLVDGGGKTVMSFKNVPMRLDFKGVAVQGKEFMHYQINDVKFTMNATLVTYQFDNIIKGNSELSKTVNEAFNKNWDVLLEQFKPVIQEIIEKYTMSYTNNILKYVPIVSV